MAKHTIIDSTEKLETALRKLRRAADIYATFPQEKVDEIFRDAALAACKARIPLAKQAVAETGMGVVEDKVIKNTFASENIYSKYKDMKTCGVIDENESAGTLRIAAPLGIIAAVIPTTNPTSTAIFKCLLALKTRNAIILSPHPRAKCCIAEAARIVRDAAENAGAPEGLITWIDKPSLELTNLVMHEADVILATGGPGMVKSAYSSGKPAIGVGAGNTPAVIDSTADITLAVSSIIHSKTFDNGMICASEQSVIVLSDMYDAVKREFTRRGCYFLNRQERDKIRKTIIINGAVNAKIVGQTAATIAEMAEITLPEGTKILIGEVTDTSIKEEFAHEKLSPVLAMYKADSFEDAMAKAERLIADGGRGHTSSVFLNERTETDKINKFARRMKTCRILVNTPAAQGGIGDVYNFDLAPSLTLGCGSWGGNSVSENVGARHLLNIKTVAKRRENMLWFRVPPKVYIQRGCLNPALDELIAEGKKRFFIVTDEFLNKTGIAKPIIDKLSESGGICSVFSDVQPDPNISSAVAGAKQMTAFEPDCIIALGGGSAMDAGKIMWVLYEHPDVEFGDLALRFSDIRKRVYKFPKMGVKASFIAIPTTAGTGSEVTPFAVITDDQTHIKYPLADYELLPNAAVVDANLMIGAPKSLTAASGIDALTHALEAYASVMATQFTDAAAEKAGRIIFDHLPAAYDDGGDIAAREQTAHAATLAGMAFANAFLGVCHSMAHKLGAYHHIPHGVANALLIAIVIRFNSAEAPLKMGSFPQYPYPRAKERYAQFAQAMGIVSDNDDDCVNQLIERIELLKSHIGIKQTIRDYGVEESVFLEKLDEMSEQAFDDQCTGANPRYPLIAEIKQMYLEAYYGKTEGGSANNES
jgi:acetaldehyde dehydrogenase/alcohol dehydrogenase